MTGVPPPPRLFHCAVLVGHEMFVYGGKASDAVLNDLWSLDLQRLEWTKHAVKEPSLPTVYGHVMFSWNKSIGKRVISPFNQPLICLRCRFQG